MTKPIPTNHDEESHEYAWDITGTRVWVSTADKYGYWSRPGGIEGGGLWFEQGADGTLELIDYDGTFELPKAIVVELRTLGVTVGTIFE